MSAVHESFNHSSQASQSQPPGKRRVVDSEDDTSSSSDSEASSDSVPEQLRNATCYAADFKQITERVFGAASDRGADHEEFKTRVRALQGLDIDIYDKFFHVIANQHAAAVGLRNGKKWERMAALKAHYKSGTLPKFKASKRPRYCFDGAGSDSEPEEQGCTARAFLTQHHGAFLTAFSGFERVLEEMAVEREPGARASRKSGERLFADPESLRGSMHAACFAYMTANCSGFPPIPHGGSVEAADDELVELRWTRDILDVAKINEMIQNNPAASEIMQRLRAADFEECGMKVALECGKRFHRLFPNQVKRGAPKDDGSPGSYQYFEKHRNQMVSTRDQVLKQLKII